MDIAGLSTPDRNVEGVVEMMLDVTQNYAEPLDTERLFGWHAALFPTGRSGMSRIVVGAWRTEHSGPMRVVSEPCGKEKVHYEAPGSDRPDAEMKAFVDWFEQERRSIRVWTPLRIQGDIREIFARGFRCFRVSGLLMQPSSRLLACMEIADRVQTGYARSKRLVIALVFPTPSSDRCGIPLYRPSLRP